MPDWIYQTLFRSLLFRIGALQRLGAHRAGPGLIGLMGQTRPSPSLSRTLLGLRFSAPVMIGAELPGNERALAALSCSGLEQWNSGR